jgi:hypothetical protein
MTCDLPYRPDRRKATEAHQPSESRKKAVCDGRHIAPLPNLASVRQIDELHLEHPFMCDRMLRRMLLPDGNNFSYL